MLAQIQPMFKPPDLDNQDKVVVSGISFTVRYALLGAFFGCLFPLIGMGMLFFIQMLPFTMSSVVEVQRTEPLLWIIDTAPFFLGWFASFAGRREDRLRQAYALLKQDERNLQRLTRQLEVRTKQLLTSSEISSHLSTIINLDDLLTEVVNQIRGRFGYYHAHIYLLDEEYRRLTLAEAAGPAAKEMKAGGYHIALDTSTNLVARAARTGVIVRVDDVRTEANWLPNPLLPETCSEMAVPIKLGGQVVGVLDVLKEEISSMDEGDADLLHSLGNQVAVAIRNARLFARAETALAEARLAQERYSEKAWEKTKLASEAGQYLYVNSEAPAPDKRDWEVMAEIEQEALAQKQAVVVEQGAVEKTLAAPITLHNRVIGSLQLHAAGQESTWSEDDMALVEAVVDQLAQTAENLRLFDETRERASREQTIREISDKLRAAPSLEILLETAARELGQRLGVRHTVLEFGTQTDANGRELHESTGVETDV